MCVSHIRIHIDASAAWSCKQSISLFIFLDIGPPAARLQMGGHGAILGQHVQCPAFTHSPKDIPHCWPRARIPTIIMLAYADSILHESKAGFSLLEMCVSCPQPRYFELATSIALPQQLARRCPPQPKCVHSASESRGHWYLRKGLLNTVTALIVQAFAYLSIGLCDGFQ